MRLNRINQPQIQTKNKYILFAKMTNDYITLGVYLSTCYVELSLLSFQLEINLSWVNSRPILEVS